MTNVTEPVTSLIRYDSMCRAIDAAYEVDEVKDIRDKAMALEAYARQARNTEAERRACEIRLRAERRTGELLGKLKRSALSNGGDAKSAIYREKPISQSEYAAALASSGISQTQAQRWQQLAGVPKDQFESALAAPERPTTSGIIDTRRTKDKSKAMDDTALWLWGRLRDIEREGVFERNPNELLDEMTEGMRADVVRLVSTLCDWFSLTGGG